MVYVGKSFFFQAKIIISVPNLAFDIVDRIPAAFIHVSQPVPRIHISQNESFVHRLHLPSCRTVRRLNLNDRFISQHGILSDL